MDPIDEASWDQYMEEQHRAQIQHYADKRGISFDEMEKEMDEHDRESLRRYEDEERSGLTDCSKCGEWSLVRGKACTLGYPGHPGAEWSETYECINPECQYQDIAG